MWTTCFCETINIDFKYYNNIFFLQIQMMPVNYMRKFWLKQENEQNKINCHYVLFSQKQQLQQLYLFTLPKTGNGKPCDQQFSSANSAKLSGSF